MYRQTNAGQGVQTSARGAGNPLGDRLGAEIAAAPGSVHPQAAAAVRQRRVRRSEEVRPRRQLGISIRPLEIRDFVKALAIALTNFGNELHLIALSYAWYFWRRAGLPEIGTMWGRRPLIAYAAGLQTANFDLVTSFIHGRGVAWLDLARLNGTSANTALAAIRQWPLGHRLLIVRVHRSIVQRFLAAGFELAGNLPDGSESHCYLHASRAAVRSDAGPRVRLGLGRRVSPAAMCEFSMVERHGERVGLTGIYGVAFWRGVIWGAWGAMHPSCARRDAVFETLRLTEERARAEGAGWFCLETSDCDKYRHARKIYELYGLELLLSVPNFYAAGRGTPAETLMVYGKPLGDAVSGKTRRAFDLVTC